MCVFLIDHKFVHAGGFAIAGAVLSAPGLIHQEMADVTFKTFKGSEKQVFGLSSCAFFTGGSI